MRMIWLAIVALAALWLTCIGFLARMTIRRKLLIDVLKASLGLCMASSAATASDRPGAATAVNPGNVPVVEVEWTAGNGEIRRRVRPGPSELDLPAEDGSPAAAAAATSEATFIPEDWVEERRTTDTVVWRHRRMANLFRAEISSQPAIAQMGQRPDSDAISPVADGRGGFRYTAGTVRIRMPRDLHRPVTLWTAGRRLAFRTIGMARDGRPPYAAPRRSRARRAGTEITYPGLFPGVTAEYSLFGWGIKGFYVLERRPTLQGQTLDFVEEIDMPGLELRVAGRPVTTPMSTSESIAIVNPATGETVLTLPSPFAVDAARATTPVVQQIERVGRTVRIRYRTPSDWLADPRRAYPVRIDPSPATITASYSVVSIAASSWTNAYISSGYFSGQAYRTGIDFSTAVIPDSSIITNVQLRLTIDDQAGTVNNDVGRMTATALSYRNANNQSGFWADVDGNEYLSNSSAFAGLSTHTVALLAAASADLQCQLTADWFSVGFTGTTESGSSNYRDGKSYTEANPPAIIVTYTAATPTLTASMASQPTYDPVRGTTNPLYIPLGYALHTATVSNSGKGDADSDSAKVTVAVPPQSVLYVGDLGGVGSGPVTFTDGAQSSGLSYGFSSLSSTTDNLQFSNNNGASWTYVPTPDAQGFDAAVTNLRVSPSGVFRGNRCGSTATSFTVSYRTQTR